MLLQHSQVTMSNPSARAPDCPFLCHACPIAVLRQGRHVQAIRESKVELESRVQHLKKVYPVHIERHASTSKVGPTQYVRPVTLRVSRATALVHATSASAYR